MRLGRIKSIKNGQIKPEKCILCTNTGYAVSVSIPILNPTEPCYDLTPADWEYYWVCASCITRMHLQMQEELNERN
jgi:hypothetical protein